MDVFAIGEALIEFAEIEHGSYRQSFAGDVLNTLYYSTKLGLTTSFFSTFGTDSFTDDLIGFLDANQIDHSYCKTSQEKNNGLYIIKNFSDGEPQFTFFRNDSAAKQTFDQPIEALPESKAIIFSAIGLAIFNNTDRLLELLSNVGKNTIIYFDLNIREALWKNKSDLIAMLPQLAKIVTTLSLSRSDDEKLFGKRTIEEIISYYTNLGFNHIILRDGGSDITIKLDNGSITIPVQQATHIVDATGAGDAFNAAYICGMLKGQTPIESAQQGNMIAARVLSGRGGIVG